MQFTAAFATLALGAVAVQAGHQINFSAPGCDNAIMQVPGHGNYGTGTYDFGEVGGVIASAAKGVQCSQDGVPCSSIEFALNGGVSSADNTLISPHKYTGAMSFTLIGANPGDKGPSATCDNPNCGPDNAFYIDGTDAQSQRQVNDANAGINLSITC
ncbi:hypothetical protein CBOM_01915 [Ceraceosorus bombacis]|uniref:Glycopeptide n=1 Tax=Ceraceosorus bombacis TaxID=401625 RepID=A0A0P1BD90_9BASI|nr:hypothetical protein CBOM_01915 [Ceraceosorus bombacis]